MQQDLGGWTPPLGMTVEHPDWLPRCVVLNYKGLGWMTVDFKTRFFGLGIGQPRRFRNVPGFTGGDWRKRLMTAAAETLIAAVD